MSFEAIAKSDYTPKKKEINITVGDQTHIFYANEITHFQRLHVSTIQNQGGDAFSKLVVYSITDRDGKHMSEEQAASLSAEHAGLFFKEAAAINYGTEQDEKN